eukprot:GHVN01086960.1.p1 GENE.GHVN01086960.1~~GHVN01086960.1.p1  ORF type:complete len:316 (-),score=124.19 GHVN01086960.1:90-944(-)
MNKDLQVTSPHSLHSPDAHDSPHSPNPPAPDSAKAISLTPFTSLTSLKYWVNSDLTHSTAIVVSVEKQTDEKKAGDWAIVLDQTIFHPQGGGQPADVGVIKGKGDFNVEGVAMVNGVVAHLGRFSSETFKCGDQVELEVDIDKRRLHSRIHSAGHLLDAAVSAVGLKWRPGKGYHFPAGPYVEYLSNIEDRKYTVEERTELAQKLQVACNSLLAKGGKVQIEYDPKPESDSTPLYYSVARTVTVCGMSCLCGGTHVSEVSEVGEMKIRKVTSPQKGVVRVGYEV